MMLLPHLECSRRMKKFIKCSLGAFPKNDSKFFFSVLFLLNDVKSDISSAEVEVKIIIYIAS